MRLEAECNTDEELVAQMRDWDLSQEVIDETLKHERAHIKKARELGYAFLGYKAIRTDEESYGFTCFVRATPLIPKTEDQMLADYVSVAFSVSNPSDEDIERCKEVMSRLAISNPLMFGALRRELAKKGFKFE